MAKARTRASGQAAAAFDGYVVAVGASAGGLDALEHFFHGLSATSGLAFVVIQHLSPDHKSMMANLLARHTRMPVKMVEDGMRLEANQVYLIPPASLMTVSEGVLRLSPKNPRGLSLPIDLFFTSLAREYGERAVGVVLSGTGSDGTRDAVAINDAGGLLLAQNPETAKFDGMPRSVIATGLVDAVLEAEALGPRILEHTHQSPRPRLATPGKVDIPTDRELLMEEILHLLHQLGGVNFREYKPATVIRRLERRMQVRHVADLENYLSLLESERAEVLTLRREILIPVTSFFRDPDSFELLATTAIDGIVQEKRDAQPIRVWVAGTSTGEEAYTVAILFAEAFERAKRWPSLKIFATDVEQQNIEAAGVGVYSESIAAEVSPERLERFFIKRGNHFVVKTEIRQNIVFAKHNLLEDPPFTRMDLVTCRNVLIYLKPPAQERVLRRLQYAMAPNASLFLGSSESLANLQRDFSPVSSKHKIYKVLRHVSLTMDAVDRGLGQGLPTPRRPALIRSQNSMDGHAIEAGQIALLKGYVPPSLLLTGKHELIHVFGDAQRYLRIGEGAASLDLTRLLPERMSPVAVALLHKAARDKTPIRSDLLSYDLPDGTRERIRLVARPTPARDGAEPILVLSIEAEPVPEPVERGDMTTIDVDAETSERVQLLERELNATRESLQATIEELETSNEELQATNEELMASNEELQSSNEELQSVNEELYTVNAENQEKIEILNRLNADLDSMAKASSIATLFVDEQLRLTRFTPEATQLFKIRETDIGRSLDDFANLLDYPEFVEELRVTLAQGRHVEREITASNGKCYLTRILAYSVPSSDIRGAVVSFVDVTSLRDVHRLQGILDALPANVAVLDADGTISMVNAAWREHARHHGDPGLSSVGPGTEGLKALKAQGMLDDGRARQVQAGIKKVLAGKQNTFSVQFPVPGVGLGLLHVAAIQALGGGVVMTHIEATGGRGHGISEDEQGH